uniref:hypothetical protein n=1 Tax=Agathobacter sp. TaxID=2021311 RepID=UPI0040571610
MQNYLQFYDACKIGKNLYFSAKEFNGLFKYNIDEEKVELISRFYDEHLWKKNLHHQIIRFDHKLYFIPYNGNGISVYNLIMNKIDFISLSVKEENSISRAFLCKNKILLIPMHSLDLLGYYNIITGEMESLQGLRSKIELILGDDFREAIYFDMYGVCKVDDKLFLIPYRQNIVCCIDLVSLEIDIMKIGEEKLDNIIFHGGELWITSAEKSRVYRVEFITKKFKIYDIPTSCEEIRPFFRVESMDNKLILLPCYDTNIYIYDKENDAWQMCDNVSRERPEHKDILSTLLCNGVMIERKNYFFPVADDGIWILNEKNQIYQKKKLSCEKYIIEEVRESYKVFIEFSKKRHLIINETDLELEMFLNMLEKNMKSKNNEVGMNEIAREIVEKLADLF